MKSRTEPTPEERRWWAKLTTLWDSKPVTLAGFADGDLHAVSSDVIDDSLDDFQGLDLPPIRGVGGGDPWRGS